MNTNASHQGISRRSVLKTGGAASGLLAWGNPAVVGEVAGKKRGIAYLYRGDRVSEGDILVLDDAVRRETATGFCHSCRERIRGALFRVQVEGKQTRGVRILSPNRSFSAGDRVNVVATYDSCVDGRECDDRNGEELLLDREVLIELRS